MNEITTAEAATRLDITPRAVQKLCERGRLEFRRLTASFTLISIDSVENFRRAKPYELQKSLENKGKSKPKKSRKK